MSQTPVKHYNFQITLHLPTEINLNSTNISILQAYWENLWTPTVLDVVYAIVGSL